MGTNLPKLTWFPRYILQTKNKEHPWKLVGITGATDIISLDEVHLKWDDQKGWVYDPEGDVPATEITIRGRSLSYIWPGDADSFIKLSTDTREELFADGKLKLPDLGEKADNQPCLPGWDGG